MVLRALVPVILLPMLATPVTGAAPTTNQKLHAIETQTEAIRGLHQIHAVTARLLADRKYDATVTALLRRDEPDSELAIGQRESVLFGLLTRHQSLRDIYFKDYSAQTAGLYDQKTHVLYVRSHNNQAFGIDRDTIAHEYTHALQDQFWNLSKFVPDETHVKYRNSDLVSAHHALTEGDATTVQFLYVNRNYTAAEHRAWLKEQMQPPSGPTLPRAFNRDFLFAYTSGLSFVVKLYQSGGMSAINAAYAHPPSSTYEIMHPDAYARGWKPLAVTLHGVRGVSGWKQTDDDVFGAFEYKLLMWQYLPEKAADAAVAGYRGDRYIFLQHGSQNAALLASVWTSNASATAAARTYVQSLKARYPHARMAHGGQVLIGSDQAVAVVVAGNRVTIAYAPTAQLSWTLAHARRT